MVAHSLQSMTQSLCRTSSPTRRQPARPLKALGLKSLDDIPDHIPTLAWSWVTTGFSGKLAHEVMHVAFGRFDADSGKAAAHMGGKEEGKDCE